jgi:hypothetical protein
MNFLKFVLILTTQSVWATQKFCVNCKHFLPLKLNFLTPTVEDDYATCALFSINRQSPDETTCGIGRAVCDTTIANSSQMSEAVGREDINNLDMSLVSETKVESIEFESDSLDYIYDYADNYSCYTARHFEEMCGKSGKRYVENTQSESTLPSPIQKVSIPESPKFKDDIINDFVLSFLKKLIRFLDDHLYDIE